MKIRQNYVKAEIDNDLFVLVPFGEEHEETNCVIELNETAAQIYDGIADGLDADGIAAQLVAEYGISPEKAAQDVKKIIDRLTEAGVVE